MTRPAEDEVLRPAVPSRLSSRRTVRLLGATLLLVLIAVGYVQWRQYRLFDGLSHYQNDALGWSFSQLEIEQLRFRNQVQIALDDELALDRELLQRRYDIFVSRVGLVDHERAAEAMQDQANYRPTLARVNAFIAEADRSLGSSPSAAVTREGLRDLLGRLDQLNGPLHDLSTGAAHQLYQRAAARNAAIYRHNRVNLALTAFQGVLMLVLAFIVMRQFKVLREGRRSLEGLAQNLQAARREAETASRSKSVFLANMSHEIRTPFHGMLGMMSLLQETPLTLQQAGFLGTAKESAHHLLTILNDILDISKLESGQLRIVCETVDLPQLIGQVESLMRALAHSRGLELAVHVANDVPRWVHADATRVKQILFNLLSNAVKFSSAGVVRLHVAQDPEGAMRFVVSDSGIGMDRATLDRLFQRFVQGDATTSRRHGGTGLGLEISRNLARLMNGDITAVSEPGVGSSFTVTLPLASVAAPMASGHDAASVPNERPLRVLVAEDHPVNRAYMQAVLDKLGHEAVFSEDGEAAVRAMHESDAEFDIVLMDLHMPVMDGFKAARAIRAMPPPRGEVPILALTADAFQESRDHARQTGMNGFLTKPAHLPQLREALARYAVVRDTDRPAVLPLPAVASMPAPSDDEHLDRATAAHVAEALSPEQYAALLKGFFDSHGASLAGLRDALANTARGDVRTHAHALRGAALSLGLRTVAQTAGELQARSADTPVSELARLLDALDQHLLLTRDLCVRLGLLSA
jgi:signal transduction histidine kinase/CheY-like chemotaxis protein/HPt (histidine-containing phosphotransfer) domain-containing protein